MIAYTVAPGLSIRRGSKTYRAGEQLPEIVLDAFGPSGLAVLEAAGSVVVTGRPEQKPKKRKDEEQQPQETEEAGE